MSFESCSSLWGLLKRLLRVSAKFEDGHSPVFTRASPANRSPTPALLPVRSRFHWISVVTEPFCCQFLRCLRVPAVPVSRFLVLLQRLVPVYAFAGLVSPPMISKLCSEQTHVVCTDWELNTGSGHGFGGLPPICRCFPRRFRPCRPARPNTMSEPIFSKTLYIPTPSLVKINADTHLVFDARHDRDVGYSHLSGDSGR